MRTRLFFIWLFFTSATLAFSQKLPTVEQVLEHYQRAIGGAETIKTVRSETQRGEIEGGGLTGKATFIGYAKPFKQLQRMTLPDGKEAVSGFDGRISWAIQDGKAEIDKDTPLESDRRDADLQYALHEPDYFKKYEVAGVTDFEGRKCYWLHGTTNWGKDNNQYYDVETGLVLGYRFQADQGDSNSVITLLFQDYKSFGGPKVATKQIVKLGDKMRTVTIKSISYEPLDDSLFELPPAVKALLK